MAAAAAGLLFTVIALLKFRLYNAVAASNAKCTIGIARAVSAVVCAVIALFISRIDNTITAVRGLVCTP